MKIDIKSDKHEEFVWYSNTCFSLSGPSGFDTGLLLKRPMSKRPMFLCSVLGFQPTLEFDIGPLSKRPVSYVQCWAFNQHLNSTLVPCQKDQCLIFSVGLLANTWIRHWSLVKKTNVLCLVLGFQPTLGFDIGPLLKRPMSCVQCWVLANT